MDLPWPSREEEGLRVDSDTLRYLKQYEPLCPSRKCGPNLGEAKIQNDRSAGGHFGFTNISYLKKILLK